MTVIQKFVAQIGIALGIGLFFYTSPGYSTELSVPFFKTFMPDLGTLYIPFAILVIVGCSNAVNLTDGLDGLAIGPVMVASVAYAVVAYAAGNKVVSEYLLIPYIEGAGELAVLMAAVFGSSLGFLCSTPIRRRCSWGTSVPCLSARPWARSPWSVSTSCC